MFFVVHPFLLLHSFSSMAIKWRILIFKLQLTQGISDRETPYLPLQCWFKLTPRTPIFSFFPQTLQFPPTSPSMVRYPFQESWVSFLFLPLWTNCFLLNFLLQFLIRLNLNRRWVDDMNQCPGFQLLGSTIPPSFWGRKGSNLP